MAQPSLLRKLITREYHSDFSIVIFYLLGHINVNNNYVVKSEMHFSIVKRFRQHIRASKNNLFKMEIVAIVKFQSI